MIDKAIEVLESELECIGQNGCCDRSCDDCDLAIKCSELEAVYEWVIDLLKEKKKIEEELKRFSDKMAEMGQPRFKR